MSLKPLKETVKLLEAIENSKSLEESLRTGNMSGFLMLEDSTEAIEALNKNVNAVFNIILIFHHFSNKYHSQEKPVIPFLSLCV